MERLIELLISYRDRDLPRVAKSIKLLMYHGYHYGVCADCRYLAYSLPEILPCVALLSLGYLNSDLSEYCAVVLSILIKEILEL